MAEQTSFAGVAKLFFLFDELARPARFERATLCLEDKSKCAISLLFLGSACFLHHRFVWYSGVIGPKLDPTFGMNP
jgi:hypothetical protein